MLPVPQMARVAFLVSLALFLSGCSLASLGGRYANWYAMKRLDDQFDLSDAQREYLEPRVKEHVRWLKADLLQRAASVVNGAAARVRRGLRTEDIAWLESQVEGLRAAAHARLADDALWLLSRLSDEQRARMQKRTAKRRERIRERLSVKPEEYRENRLERYQELCEEWIGDLTPAQEQLLANLLGPMADLEHGKLFMAGQEEVGDRFYQVVTPPIDGKRLETFVATWVRDPAALRSERASEQYRQRMQMMRDFATALAKTLTPKQREHLIDELETLRKRILDFAGTET